MTFDPEFVEFVQYLAIFFGSVLIAWIFGGVCGWSGAWLAIAILDITSDIIQDWKKQFRLKRLNWNPPKNRPL